MAEDNNITRIDGELLPATSNLMEVTKALQIANSSFEKSVVSVEKVLPTEDLVVQMDDPFRNILESMDQTLKQISNHIRMFMDGLLNTFFDINENQVRTIIIQEKQLELDDEKFTYQKDKDQDERQTESKGTESEGFGSEPKEREGFLGEVDKAQKDFEEKGFLNYVSELTGIDGTIKMITDKIARFAPLVMPLLTGLGAAFSSLFAGIVATMSAIGAALGTLVTGIVAALSPIIAAVGAVLLPVALIVAAAVATIALIKGFVDGFTANADDGFATKILRGYTRAIETLLDLFIMWPLDQLKNLVSWIAGALGFADVEKALDSFSYQESFAEIMDSFEEWITSIPTAISEFFSDMIDSLDIGSIIDTIGEKLSNFIETIGEKLSNFFEPVFEPVISIIKTIGEKLSNFFEPVISMFSFIGDILDDAGNAIAEFFSGDFFDLSKIKSMLTNLFAEIGVPRIEFDVPVIGKVGFGPFYPFMPDQVTDPDSGKTLNTTVVSATESADTEYTTTMDSAGNVVESGNERITTAITSLDSGSVGNPYSEGMSSSFQQQELVTENGGDAKFKNSLGAFDFEKGEGTISISQTDPSNELNEIMQEYKVSGITFGQVRRLIDDGASPDEVEMFLKNKQKSIFDKLSDFLSAPAETTPIDVAAVETNRMDTANELAVQTAEREETKATQSQQPINVVNAPTSNVSNVSQSTAFFDTPSAVDGLSMSY